MNHRITSSGFDKNQIEQPVEEELTFLTIANASDRVVG